MRLRERLKSLKTIKIIYILSLLALSGCAVKTEQTFPKKISHSGMGFIELVCPDNYFYGDLTYNLYDNQDLEIDIYNFGTPILKITDYANRLRIFYLGNEVSDNYYNFFPVDIKSLKNIIRDYVKIGQITEKEAAVLDIDNKKYLIFNSRNCTIKILAERVE